MELFTIYRDMLRLSPSAVVLDFGCGGGDIVRQGRAAGFQTFGCDFDTTAEHCFRIEQPYRLPFADATFDAVISNQVLEHVMDYDIALAELRRVMKPGAAYLHMFPPRTTPIEPHVFVPLATVVRSRGWLYLWALLGIRNQFQRGLSAAEVADSNHAYLLSSTNYLRRKQIVALFRRHFGKVRFAEAEYLRHSPRRAVRSLSSVPGVPTMYRWLRGYVIHGAAT